MEEANNQEQEVQDHEKPHEHAEKAHQPAEAHRHAQPRLMVGIGAVILIIIGVVVWSQWGEDIKEACFGEDGLCPVEVPEGSTANMAEPDLSFFDTVEIPPPPPLTPDEMMQLQRDGGVPEVR